MCKDRHFDEPVEIIFVLPGNLLEICTLLCRLGYQFVDIHVFLEGNSFEYDLLLAEIETHHSSPA